MKTRFIYYNPNPSYKNQKRWMKGDCVFRALSKAFNCTWLKAFDMCIDIARHNYDTPCSREIIAEALIKHGYTKMSYKKGCKRETVEEFAKNHRKGTYIMILAGHICCCQDGHYYDTWDCGCKTLYNYYTKKEDL